MLVIPLFLNRLCGRGAFKVLVAVRKNFRKLLGAISFWWIDLSTRRVSIQTGEESSTEVQEKLNFLAFCCDQTCETWSHAWIQLQATHSRKQKHVAINVFSVQKTAFRVWTAPLSVSLSGHHSQKPLKNIVISGLCHPCSVTLQLESIVNRSQLCCFRDSCMLDSVCSTAKVTICCQQISHAWFVGSSSFDSLFPSSSCCALGLSFVFSCPVRFRCQQIPRSCFVGKCAHMHSFVLVMTCPLNFLLRSFSLSTQSESVVDGFRMCWVVVVVFLHVFQPNNNKQTMEEWRKTHHVPSAAVPTEQKQKLNRVPWALVPCSTSKKHIVSHMHRS